MLDAERPIAGFRGLQRRVLAALKRAQPLTVKELAVEFKTTPNAVRRHLKAPGFRVAIVARDAAALRDAALALNLWRLLRGPSVLDVNA